MSKGPAYYNEFDPHAAAWLRELIKADLIAPGDVDERSIEDVRPEDLSGYEQCHFFAGIGGWSLALRMAGWADTKPVWTGSCPCQPFSSAGKRKAAKDKRNLWPQMFRLIDRIRPTVVFGEQVASSEVVGTVDEAAFVAAIQAGDYAKANNIAERIARKLRDETPEELAIRWVDGISADLEPSGYAVRFKVLGAHSVGAPHIRQRLYWLADAERAAGRPHTVDGSDVVRQAGKRSEGADWPRECRSALRLEHLQHGRSTIQESGPESGRTGELSRLEHDPSDGREQRRAESGERGATSGRSDGGLGVGVGEGLEGHAGHGVNGDKPGRLNAVAAGPATSSSGLSHWSDFAIVACRDGKFRRVPRAQSEVQRVVDGLLADLGRTCSDLIAKTKEEVNSYAKSSNHSPDEIVRMVQSANGAKAICERPTGRQRSFPPATTLLKSLLNIASACDRTSVSGGIPQKGDEDEVNGMLSVRSGNQPFGSSRRREPDEQFARQLANALPQLSQLLARCKEAIEEELARQNAGPIYLGEPCADLYPLAIRSPGRVGKLKGYGNAIVPQVAAEFIKAYLES